MSDEDADGAASEATAQAQADAADQAAAIDEQAKIDAANEGFDRAQEQERIDAANEGYDRAQEQERIDAANEGYDRAQEQERIDAANEGLARAEAEAAAQQTQRSSSLSLTQLVVGISLIAALIAAAALQRSRSSDSRSTSADSATTVARQDPPAVERSAQAQIAVNAREDDGRTITFQSIVNLTSASVPGTNLGRSFRGKGTGPYREQFISNQCEFTITWTGEVNVEVLALVDQRSVDVAIGGPVRQVGEWPGESCLGGTYYAPHRPLPARFARSCRFDNVDFTRGGIYKGPPPEETADPYSCTLTIGPLISPTPTPGTGPR